MVGLGSCEIEPPPPSGLYTLLSLHIIHIRRWQPQLLTVFALSVCSGLGRWVRGAYVSIQLALKVPCRTRYCICVCLASEGPGALVGQVSVY